MLERYQGKSVDRYQGIFVERYWYLQRDIFLSRPLFKEKISPEFYTSEQQQLLSDYLQEVVLSHPPKPVLTGPNYESLEV